MITFKKNSWHYKLYTKAYGNWGNMPSSICPYFWKIVWAVAFEYCIKWCLISLVVVAALTSAVVIFSVPSIGLGLFLGEGSSNTVWGLPFYHWKVILFDLCCWLGLFSFFVCITLIQQRKEPSVFLEWVKAKKNKICPLIQFKE